MVVVVVMIGVRRNRELWKIGKLEEERGVGGLSYWWRRGLLGK